MSSAWSHFIDVPAATTLNLVSWSLKAHLHLYLDIPYQETPFRLPFSFPVLPRMTVLALNNFVTCKSRAGKDRNVNLLNNIILIIFFMFLFAWQFCLIVVDVVVDNLPSEPPENLRKGLDVHRFKMLASQRASSSCMLHRIEGKFADVFIRIYW